MKNKISLLIYKKLDNTISEKELKLLNKYLEENKEFQEEYSLIKNISDELKKDNNAKLPDNFKIKLREKLVDYNLNKDSLSKKRKFFPVNTVATAVVAMFLVVFAFNTDIKAPTNNTLDKPNTSYEYKTSENNSEIQNEKQRMLSTQSTDSSDINTHTVNDKSSVINEQAIVKNTTKEIADSTTSENSGNSSDSSNQPMIASLESEDSIIIKTNCDISVFKDIKMESTTYNTYKISMSEYSLVKELLKDIPFEIQNENEENLAKDYFILEIN